MSINQDIRFTDKTDDPNNPHGLYSFVTPSRNIKGVGEPPSDLGQNEWIYIDETSGVEYLKQNGVWQPFFDFSTVPVTVDDPLTGNLLKYDELDVDTVRGKASDSVGLDLGATGNLNILANAVHGIHMSTGFGDNVTINANGFAQFNSGVRAYDVLADDFVDKQIKIDAATMTISNTGALNVMTVENQNGQLTLASNTDIDIISDVNRIKTGAGNEYARFDNINDPRMTMKAIPGNNPDAMIYRAQGMTKLDNNQLQIQHEVNDFDTRINNKGTGRLLVSNSTTANEIRVDANLNEISNNNPGDFSVKGGVLNLESTGGNLVLKSANQIDCNNETMVNVDMINIGASRHMMLGATPSNQLTYQNPNSCFSFCFPAVGSNGTKWGDVGGFVVAPGEVSCVYVPYVGATLNMISAVLHFNNVWSFTQGTAQLDLVYIPAGAATTAANAVLITSLIIPTNVPFYQYSISSNTSILLPGTKLAMRLVTAGVNSTSTSAEIIANIFVN